MIKIDMVTFRKKNNKIAFKLYNEAAEFGLYHAYGNLGKFYVLGLGGIKKIMIMQLSFINLKELQLMVMMIFLI